MKSYRLRQNIIVPTIELSFHILKDMDFNDTPRLRGFIGKMFSRNILLHNHDNDTLRYSYPRVQYKVINSHAIVVGLAEGIEELKPLAQLERIIIGHEDMQIENFEITEDKSPFGILNDQTSYSFLTPWLALNEKNYDKYQRIGTWPKKKDLLESILIGNIISMSKSLGYTVPEPIKANIQNLKEVPTKLKDTLMLGFLGTFSVNFEIPDYWGIGKSVSRGFGTIKQVRKSIELDSS